MSSLFFCKLAQFNKANQIAIPLTEYLLLRNYLH